MAEEKRRFSLVLDTKTGKRAHFTKPPFYKTALLFPLYPKTGMLIFPRFHGSHFRVWLNGGLAKGGAGTRFSPQSPSQPACRPSISVQQHRVLNVSGLRGRTLKQKWIAGSNLLLECRQAEALNANKKRHYPPRARNGDFGDLGVARPAEKTKMAIFRSASRCGFGDFSRQNGEKRRFWRFQCGARTCHSGLPIWPFWPETLERIARPEALQTNRCPVTGISVSVVS